MRLHGAVKDIYGFRGETSSSLSIPTEQDLTRISHKDVDETWLYFASQRFVNTEEYPL